MRNYEKQKTVEALQKIILRIADKKTAKDYEILGRALHGCECLSFCADGSIYNCIYCIEEYQRKMTDTKRAVKDLISRAIKEFTLAE